MSQSPCHPISDEAIRRFPAFVSQVTQRLRKGADQYGDSSFARPPAELLQELSNECLDLAGWGFVLWHRIQVMLDRLDDQDT